MNGLGNIASLRGDSEKAEYFYRESLAISKEIGDRNLEADCINNLGLLKQNEFDLQQAETLFQESLGIKKRLVTA